MILRVSSGISVNSQLSRDLSFPTEYSFSHLRAIERSFRYFILIKFKKILKVIQIIIDLVKGLLL